jgi:biofilm PGA synthesis N-glycosyltransferase PgaC
LDTGLLTLLALALALLHFGVPLAYYSYLRVRWLSKPWGIVPDPNYRPKVTVIVPTYNEAELIESKLDDLARQDYPSELLEVVVVDSASTDGTVERVEGWVGRGRGLRLSIVRESVRRGKAFALNNTLKHATGDVVVITDVDARWGSANTLSNAISWLGDPSVGAVTCLKKPAGRGMAGVEERYREFYNVVRLAESKAHSTPVFHGELAAFRKSLLNEVGGFPTSIGADDSHTATMIALRGYRSIAVDNAWCVESVPPGGYHWWRIRRAQHLIQHFTKTLRLLPKAPREFEPVLLVESWLHLFNPWLLLVATILLLRVATGSPLATTLLALGIALLIFKPYRTWVATQVYLVIAAIRNLWTKEIAWEKQEK